jgi:N-acetylglucosaminyldiphosphoundecaprenol N-acetyl-beta-D-mannosaminyltransferase
MTSTRYYLWQLPVDALTMSETLSVVENILKQKKKAQHTVVNAAKIVKAQKDEFLKECIQKSDLVNVDGQAVVWAARLLGVPVPERVTGIDLMVELLKLADRKSLRVYFLGATQEVLNELVETVKTNYPKAVISGTRNGYFSESEADQIVSDINASNSDILFVGMPTPQKEMFIHQHQDALNVSFCMGVGGSFDVLAGKTKRAPVWLQKAGMEWFYRLSQEPKRLFGRYAVTNTAFGFLVMRGLITKGLWTSKK